MRSTLAFLACFSLMSACVSEPVTPPAQDHQPGAEAAPGGGAGPQPAAEQAPAQPTMLAPPQEGVQPSFTALLEPGAETVTISGTVNGLSSGFVEFFVFYEESQILRAVHTQDFSGGAFSVEAPASFPHEIILHGGVRVDDSGELPDPSTLLRFISDEPISLGTEDLSLVLTAKRGLEPLYVLLGQAPPPPPSEPPQDAPAPAADDAPAAPDEAGAPALPEAVPASE
jgi:hypothetical protein